MDRVLTEAVDTSISLRICSTVVIIIFNLVKKTKLNSTQWKTHKYFVMKKYYNTLKRRHFGVWYRENAERARNSGQKRPEKPVWGSDFGVFLQLDITG